MDLREASPPPIGCILPELGQNTTIHSILVPLEGVCGGVDIGQESHVFFCAVGEAFVRFDTDVVDGDARTEVDGIGAYHVGIATGIAESVNVGVDAVGAGQMMHAMADFFSEERVILNVRR